MEKEKEETIWIRDENDELIPKIVQELVIPDTRGLFLEKEIKKHESYKLGMEAKEDKKEDDEKNILVYIEAIKLLKKALKERKQDDIHIKNFTYLPIIQFETDLILLKLGLDGKPTEDIDANICAKKCLNPKKTYEYWRDMKNPTQKKFIADYIVKNSIPKKKEILKDEAKAFQMLQGMVSAIKEKSLKSN